MFDMIILVNCSVRHKVLGKVGQMRKYNKVSSWSLHHFTTCLKLVSNMEVLLVMVYWLWQNRKIDLAPGIVFSEEFAGKHEVTKAQWQEGNLAVPIELELNPKTMDIMSPLGYSNSLATTLKTQRAKLTAPVCSTWVFVSRGSTHRSKDNPLGDESNSKVSNANAMVVRVLLLCWLAVSIGVMVILEQPVNSLMQDHPFFQTLRFDYLSATPSDLLLDMLP